MMAARRLNEAVAEPASPHVANLLPMRALATLSVAVRPRLPCHTRSNPYVGSGVENADESLSKTTSRSARSGGEHENGGSSITSGSERVANRGGGVIAITR